MKYPEVHAKTSLLTIFQDYYRPERMRWPATNTLQKWRQRIRWFDMVLGREAIVSDMSAEAIEAAAIALLQRGISSTSVDKFRKGIRTLWWYLADIGAVQNAPRRRPRGRPRVRPKVEKPKLEPQLESFWTRRGNGRKRLEKKRLIIVPRAAVEELKPSDPLDALAAAYISRKMQDCNPLSRSKYDMVVDELEFFLNRRARIEDLTDENVECVMLQVRGNGRAIPTANMYRRTLVALWNWAHKRGILKTGPDVDKLVEPIRTPVAWTREQLDRLWQACAEQTGEIGGVPASLWLLALHSVAWDTAERISAILSIRWDWLDGTSGWLRIPAEFRKGKREDKTWLLHAETLTLLERIRKPKRELIFPLSFSLPCLYGRYRTMLKKAGLPHDRKHKFHCLRKSSASWFASFGGDAVQLLGHSDPTVTRAYLSPSIVQRQQASQTLFRPNEPRRIELRDLTASAQAGCE